MNSPAALTLARVRESDRAMDSAPAIDIGSHVAFSDEWDGQSIQVQGIVEAFYFEDDNQAAVIAVAHEKLPPAARGYDCPGGRAVMEIADLRRLVVN
jgi:hypothetical protein